MTKAELDNMRRETRDSKVMTTTTTNRRTSVLNSSNVFSDFVINIDTKIVR